MRTRNKAKRNRWAGRLAAIAVLSISAPARAALIETWSGSQMLSDNDPSGWSYTFTPTNPAAPVSDVNVTLDIAGGFNGDLFAYLSHGSGYAVLLNRPGKDTGAPYGYATPGLSITLDDQAPLVGGTDDADVHLYQALLPAYDLDGRLTGGWQPDARTASPSAVTAAAPRSAYLSSFDGLTSDGSWTLFIADLSAGGVSTLQGFSIEITQVPEPSLAFVAVAGGIAIWRLRRRRSRTAGSEENNVA